MARPTTRRPRLDRPTAPQPARPLVRDFSRSAVDYAVEWDVRPAYDFLISLSDDAGSTDDLPAQDRAWLAQAKGALPASVRQDLAELFGSEVCIEIVATLLVERPELITARQYVEAIEAAEPPILLAGLFADHHGGEISVPMDAALRGDKAALAVLEQTYGRNPKGSRRVALAREPERTAQRIRGVLRAWLEQFSTIEPRVTAMIKHDYEERAADRATLPSVELVERATGGIRWLSEPGTTRVILAPSYFARPYNYIFAVGDKRLYAYPIADSALDAGDPLAPPPAVVRLYRALGDPSRLRILKLLSERDWYQTEIAQQLELSKPTVKHHLAQLRAAGLVTLTEEGNLVYYSLRRDHLDEAGIELRRFLSD